MKKTYKILVSRCLLGEAVRYNGLGFDFVHPILKKWRKNNLLIKVCPEVEGGLSTPRSPAEIQCFNGETVLKTGGIVLNKNKENVTQAFLKGAYHTLQLAKFHHIPLAILKESSPSCGSHFIYDGTFSGVKKNGKGVTSSLLAENGILVFSENEIEQAFSFWNNL